MFNHKVITDVRNKEQHEKTNLNINILTAKICG